MVISGGRASLVKCLEVEVIVILAGEGDACFHIQFVHALLDLLQPSLWRYSAWKLLDLASMTLFSPGFIPAPLLAFSLSP